MNSDSKTAPVAGGTRDSQVTQRIAAASPRSKARVASVAYWLYFLALAAGGLLIGRLVRPGNASGTGQNLLAHRLSFRLGFAFDLISTAFYLVTTVLVYDLFKPVNRSLSFLAMVFNLVGSAL